MRLMIFLLAPPLLLSIWICLAPCALIAETIFGTHNRTSMTAIGRQSRHPHH